MNNSTFAATRHVLAVKDLSRSADYYITQLGFESWWKGDGWNFVSRGEFKIMLGKCPDDRSAFETRNHSYFAYIDVTEIDRLYQEYRSKEVEIIQELADKDWGQREFGIRTVDGHRIMFGEELRNN